MVRVTRKIWMSNNSAYQPCQPVRVSLGGQDIVDQDAGQVRGHQIDEDQADHHQSNVDCSLPPERSCQVKQPAHHLPALDAAWADFQ